LCVRLRACEGTVREHSRNMRGAFSVS
jgi:hypothetical protein